MTATKTTDTATKTKRPSRAKATVVETEPTTAATANPFASLFDGVTAPIVRNATAPASGSGHKGRQRNYLDNPLGIDELIKWGNKRGRAISFKDVSDELRSALGGKVEAAIATAFERGSFDSFTQELDAETVTAAIVAVRDAIEAVTHPDRVGFVPANLAVYDEAVGRYDDVSDPYNPVYGRQSVARWALSSLGATDVVIFAAGTATVTVDPLAMFFSRSGAKNISAPMADLFARMHTPEGQRDLLLVSDACNDKQKSQLAIVMGSYIRAAAAKAVGETAEKLATLARTAPMVIANTIGDASICGGTVAALEVAVA